MLYVLSPSSNSCQSEDVFWRFKDLLELNGRPLHSIQIIYMQFIWSKRVLNNKYSRFSIVSLFVICLLQPIEFGITFPRFCNFNLEDQMYIRTNIQHEYFWGGNYFIVTICSTLTIYTSCPIGIFLKFCLSHILHYDLPYIAVVAFPITTL